MDKIRAWFQDFFVGDVLKGTQKRLTLYNSGLLMIVLILFAIIVYSLLYTVMAYQEKQNLQNLISQTLAYQGNVQTAPANQQEDPLMAGNEELFYYSILDLKGNQIAGSSRIEPIESNITNSIRGWLPNDGETKSEEFNVPSFERSGGGAHPHGGHSEKHSIQVLLAGQPIYARKQLAGIVYVGIDRSAHNRLFELLFWILAGLVLTFFFVALWISHKMAKRAMVPVQNSFIRQREFVADASHELRTPLSVLHTSLEVLELEEEDHLTDYSRQVIDDMKDEVKRMTKLVGDLLTLARLNSGTVDITLSTFDIGPFADQIVRSIKPVAANKRIKVEAQILPSLEVIGDVEKLRQLFYILLDNAIKYTPKNGEITVTLTAREKSWELRVKDSGLGIGPEDQQKIFERFYRADKNRSRKLGGTGLGLSIAHWIVTSHEGSITVESELEKGSEFIVKIPQYLKSTTT